MGRANPSQIQTDNRDDVDCQVSSRMTGRGLLHPFAQRKPPTGRLGFASDSGHVSGHLIPIFVSRPNLAEPDLLFFAVLSSFAGQAWLSCNTCATTHGSYIFFIHLHSQRAASFYLGHGNWREGDFGNASGLGVIF